MDILQPGGVKAADDGLPYICTSSTSSYQLTAKYLKKISPLLWQAAWTAVQRERESAKSTFPMSFY